MMEYKNKRPLKEAIIITNYTCNLKCTYCDVEHLSRDTLATNDIRNLIDVLHNRNVEKVHFIGGEPSMRKEIVNILKHSHQLGMKNILHSNGNLMKAIVKLLPYIGVFHTCLNGTKEKHELTRGINTYDSVIKSIELMQSNNIETNVDMILTNENTYIEEIEHVLSLAKKYGFKVNFQKVFEHNLVGLSSDNISTKIPIKVKDERFFEIFRYLLKNYNAEIMLNSIQYLQAHCNEHVVNFEQCDNGMVIIGHDGEVSPCYACMHFKNLNNGLLVGWDKALDNALEIDTHCLSCAYPNHAESNIENKGVL